MARLQVKPWNRSHLPNFRLAAPVNSTGSCRLEAASEHTVAFRFIYKVSGAGALQGVTQEPSAVA